MKQLFNITILSYCLFIFGCYHLTRTDISRDIAYQGFVGSTYVNKNKMMIAGVWALSDEPRINYYLITALPGIGGREIKDLGCLPAGTILKITKVIKRTPSVTLTNDGIRFVAEIISVGEFSGLEVDINGAYNTYTKSPVSGKYILSNEHFSQIEPE